MIERVDKDSATWAEPPWKFEAGTPPIAEAVGLGAAVDYLGRLDREALRRQEESLTRHALDALGGCRDVTVYGPEDQERRAGVVSFNLANVHPHDVAEVLDETGVAVRGGHHCCQVLMQRMEVPSMVRASFALYNEHADIERLIDGLDRARTVFGHGG